MNEQDIRERLPAWCPECKDQGRGEWKEFRVAITEFFFYDDGNRHTDMIAQDVVRVICTRCGETMDEWDVKRSKEV
jgi:hypothetical protein